MNQVSVFVTGIIGEPVLTVYGWRIKVEYDCYGNLSTTNIYFQSKQEALEIKPGHEFLT